MNAIQLMAETDDIVFDKHGTLSTNYFVVKQMWYASTIFDLDNKQDVESLKQHKLFVENGVLEENISQSMEHFEYTKNDNAGEDEKKIVSDSGNALDNSLIDLL